MPEDMGSPNLISIKPKFLPRVSRTYILFAFSCEVARVAGFSPGGRRCCPSE